MRANGCLLLNLHCVSSFYLNYISEMAGCLTNISSIFIQERFVAIFTDNDNNSSGILNVLLSCIDLSVYIPTITFALSENKESPTEQSKVDVLLPIHRNLTQVNKIVPAQENVTKKQQLLQSSMLQNQTCRSRIRFGKAPAFIFVVKTSDKLDSILKSAAEKSLWNPLGRFLICVTSPTDGEMELQVIKKWQIINVVLLFKHQLKSAEINTFDLISYNPFSTDNTSTILIDECVIRDGNVKFSGGSSANINKYFPNKVNNLNQTKLYVSAISIAPLLMWYSTTEPTDGFELTLIRTLSKYFNFQPHYNKPVDNKLWGMELPNGTLIGQLRDVSSHHADIGLGGKVLNAHTTRNVDFLRSHAEAPFCWCIPKIKKAK